MCSGVMMSPTKTAAPGNPLKPVKPANLVKPAELVKPVKPVESNEPAAVDTKAIELKAENKKVKKDVEYTGFCDQKVLLPIHFFKDKKYNESRRVRAKLLYCCLHTHTAFAELKKAAKLEILTNLESGIYNLTHDTAIEKGETRNWTNAKFSSIYNKLCFRIQTSLVSRYNSSAASLVGKMISGELNPRTVPTMTIEQLNSHATKTIKNMVNIRRKQAVKETVTTKYFCKRCKCRYATERAVQQRSLDEGMTIIITCKTDGCGNIWRINS